LIAPGLVELAAERAKSPEVAQVWKEAAKLRRARARFHGHYDSEYGILFKLPLTQFLIRRSNEILVSFAIGHREQIVGTLLHPQIYWHRREARNRLGAMIH
jgi:hypothetical protein